MNKVLLIAALVTLSACTTGAPKASDSTATDSATVLKTDTVMADTTSK